MRLSGSLSCATPPDSISFEYADAPSTLITIPPAASHGPSGRGTLLVLCPALWSTASACSNAVAISGSGFSHAFSMPAMRNGPAGALNAKRACASGSEPASVGSCPLMTASTVEQSSAVRHMGPILSIEYASAMAPPRPTRPKVGRKPETPQKAEGQTIEPQVSVPMAKAAMAEATIAPEPLDEPQVQQLVFQGFLAAPLADAAAKR